MRFDKGGHQKPPATVDVGGTSQCRPNRGNHAAGAEDRYGLTLGIAQIRIEHFDPPKMRGPEGPRLMLPFKSGPDLVTQFLRGRAANLCRDKTIGEFRRHVHRFRVLPAIFQEFGTFD